MAFLPDLGTYFQPQKAEVLRMRVPKWWPMSIHFLHTFCGLGEVVMFRRIWW